MYTKDELARRRAALSPDQLARLHLRIRQAQSQALSASIIPRRTLATPAPLSFAQQRLWFLQQFSPENTAYNELIALRLLGRLDYPALKQAIGLLIQRHEILRTTFPLHDGVPIQMISHHSDRATDLTLLDLQTLPRAERLPGARQRVEEMLQQPFHLTEEFPRRLCLLRLDREEHIFLACLHHIITDAWSLELLIKELILCYQACKEGKPSPFPALPLQYSDYAEWQRGEEASQARTKQAEYWRQKLAAPLPVLNLPLDHPRPPVLSYHGARLPWTMPALLRQGLSQLCLREDVTPFMALLSAFAILLFRYTMQEDVIIGTPVAGRNKPELESLLGCFINMLALRIDLSGRPTFQEVLRRVRAGVLAAHDQQDMPFEKLVELLQPERNTGQHPIFQTLFVLQNVPQTENGLAELEIAPFEVEVKTAILDLALVLRETPAALSGYLEYATDLFETSRMTRLLAHYQRLLAYVIAHPETRIHDIPFLTENEQRLGSQSCILSGQPRYLHQLFAEQAQRTPTAIALVTGEEQLSYRELNRRTNRLAKRLRRLGVGPEVPVGVFLPRSFDSIISFLAILKAGGAYVPLDCELPAERLASMLDQARITVILTRPPLAAELPEHNAILFDPAISDRTTIEDDENPPAGTVQPHNLAYIIYTSGSSGRPKGVLIEHQGLAERLISEQKAFGIDEQSRIPQLAALSFDVSIEEIGLALLSGATLYLGENREILPGRALQTFLHRHAITHMTLTPSLLTTLEPAELPALRTVISGGEVLAPEMARQWAERCTLFNAYGPTETTIDATSERYHVGAPLTLGYPLFATRIALLDAYLAPVPIGVPGEIYIGGPGVARGYLNQPALTAERFIPDRYSSEPGARLYKTGDLARYREDGRLEFLGRADTQVKLRGVRIELAEIETILDQHAAIAACAVMLREDTPGDQRLVAYIILQAERYASPEALQGYLRERLPGVMIPALFVYLPAFPLLPNGKLDRRALPPPDTQRPDLEAGFVAARDPIAEILARIWSQTLNLAQVGVQDHFFALGGHSLLAVQVTSRIRATFGVDLPLATFFRSPTVAALADEIKALLQHNPEQNLPPLERVERDRELPLSFTQQHQWVLEHLTSEQQLSRITGAVHLRGRLHVPALADSVNEIIRRHEILRTTFVAGTHGEPVQVIAPRLYLSVPEMDLSHLPFREQEAELLRLLEEEQKRPLDLARGPLLYVSVIRLGTNEHILLLTSHHILFDGWSIEIFLYELATLYAAFTTGQPSPLAELPLQYADYACWQQRVLSGQTLTKLLNYWRAQLADLPALTLPAIRQRLSQSVFDAGIVPVTLSSELTGDLQALSNQAGVTLFMVLLAAFQAVLTRYSQQRDIVVGSPIAHRPAAELEPLIGNFLNTLVLRTNLSGNPTFHELLERVRQVALDAYAHQELPFEQLLAELHPERTAAQNPLFQVLFAFQNLPHRQVNLPGLEASFLPSTTETTTFDLDLTMWEKDDELAGSFKYNAHLFDPDVIRQMRDDFLSFLTLVAANPQQHIEDLPLLSLDNLSRQLALWNATEASYQHEMRIHQLFEAQADRNPDALAAICDQQVLTYGELERRSNQVAHYLRTHGVAPGDMVAIFLERSLDMLPALLGTLKAGACYVPLETSYPGARVHWILHSLAIHTLLTQSTQLPILSTLKPLPALRHVLCLDSTLASLEGEQAPWQISVWEDIRRLPGDRLPDCITSHALAYIIFTSGSTGTPKGVMVRHESVINLIEWVNRTFDLNASDRVLFVTSLCFDLSVYDIFGLLAAGGSILIATGDDLREPTRLLDLLYTHSITFWDSAPAALQQLVPFFPEPRVAPTTSCLRLVFLSGDWIPLKLPDEVRARFPGAEVVSLGGATEATVWSNFYRVREIEAYRASIPYGRPIQNAQYYILDAHLTPCPPGVPGDLYIGGDCLSIGYVGEPELTAQKFLPSPFSTEPGVRLYKTGDLARFESDGLIVFLGRSDTQVKIRGFRVEPGEIEATLTCHPGVQAAIVEARRDAMGEKRLIAYVVPNAENTPTREELRDHLRMHLPVYMLPTAFLFLEHLPLTANGKVDRRRLPDPEGYENSGQNEAYVAPRGPLEEQLARIWEELLGLPRVSVTENFFLIGGHSLLAVRLMSRIESQFGKRLPLVTIFQNSTIEALARILRYHSTSSPWSLLFEIRQPAVDLLAEAGLDLETGSQSEPARHTVAATNIFLTGATGFLGLFLLGELLKQTQATIFCLLRAPTPDEGVQRLARRLQETGIWQPAYLSRIKAVPGNLATPSLGLSVTQFEELAACIDTIYHAGAATNMLYPYQELRATNVQGTREILRLAFTHHVKPLHYVSTLGVMPHRGETRVQIVHEDESIDEYQEYVRGGYAQSKWVAEKLVTSAREHGLPVVIYRPGRVTGHSQSGIWRLDDILSSTLRGCIQLGLYPISLSGDSLEMTPVDYVSKAIVAISRREDSPGRAFHLANPSIPSSHGLVSWINAFGYPIQQVEDRAWLKALKQARERGQQNALIPFLEMLPEPGPACPAEALSSVVMVDDSHTRAALAATTISCPPADARLLHVYLTYMIQQHALEAPPATDL